MLLFYWQTGGDVGLLTLGGKPFQVLQCNLFVPRAVCQAIIDHCVLKREKHTLVIDTRSGKKGTCLAPATAQIGRFSGRMWPFGCFVRPLCLYYPKSFMYRHHTLKKSVAYRGIITSSTNVSG